MDLLTLHVRQIGILIVACPLIASLTCITLSLYLHPQSTRTHCGVANLLPSISAAIGDYTPERYIWRIFIALHTAPRYACAFMYRNFYRDHISSSSSTHIIAPEINFVINLVAPLLITENLALIGMSYVSSSENFNFHEAMFIVFVTTALCNMLIGCFLSRRVVYQALTLTSTDCKKAYKLKKYSTIVNISALLLSVYLYYRHNTYCEPYVYTLFALSEYVVVLSNISFHVSPYWDFSDYTVCITPTREVTSKRTS